MRQSDFYEIGLRNVLTAMLATIVIDWFNIFVFLNTFFYDARNKVCVVINILGLKFEQKKKEKKIISREFCNWV